MKLRTHRQLIGWSLMTLAVVSGIVARFLHLSKSSIWHDEAFSILLADRTPVAIWQATARDVHPPLYYEFLHIWMKLFGDTATSVRSLSVVCGVLLIPISFIIVKKIACIRAAAIVSFIVALSPFLVRYSQETRMYSMVCLWIALSLLAIVYIIDKPKSVWPYILYSLTITLGLYTHYYTTLIIGTYWIFLISLWWPHRKSHIQVSHIVTSGKWWLSNIVALVLFSPWLGSMYAQLKRGQGLSWLPYTSISTWHDTIWQFFTFTDAHKLPAVIYWFVPSVLIIAAVYITMTNQDRHHYTRLVIWYTFIPLAIGILISIYRPIFHERYFSFAVIGIAIIISLAIDRVMLKSLWLGSILLLIVFTSQMIGIRNVYSQSNHQVGTTMSYLNQNYQKGDYLVAAELYTYFDGNYYNSTGTIPLLYTGLYAPNGYGESSLLYDKNVYLNKYEQLPVGSRVWLVGKKNQRDYYETVPSSWKLLTTKTAGYSEVRLYLVQ